MMNMNLLKYVNKISILCLIGLLFATELKAQNNTTSPYSYYGLGELMNEDILNSTGMASLAYRNGGVLNINNPAALAHIDSLRFIFKLGLVAKYSNLQQGDDNDFVNDYNLSKISFGFKVSSKYATAVSLIPYTSLGYNMTKRELVEGGDEYFYRSQVGSGGLSQLVWSHGVSLTKNLSVGINGIYLFGNNTREEQIIPEGSYSYSYNSSTKLISEGIHFNVGAQYKYEFKENSLILGVKYQPKVGVNAKLETEVLNLNVEKYSDTDHGKFDVPETYGVALGFNKGKQFWLGADYLNERWSETTKFDKSNDLLDRNKFSLAMAYEANDGYATKMLKKLTYRFGAFYDTGYMRVENERIKTKGLSFGVGFPMARGKGMINLSFEFGQMGTTDNNNVREDYGRFTLEMSLFERWFVKRKYQ